MAKQIAGSLASWGQFWCGITWWKGLWASKGDVGHSTLLLGFRCGIRWWKAVATQIAGSLGNEFWGQFWCGIRWWKAEADCRSLGGEFLGREPWE